MNMIDAVKSCFRQYVGFGGRARRSEYWFWTLFTILAGIVLGVFDGLLFGWESTDVGVFGTLFSLATFLPGLAVSWRRLHDTGRSGWWVGGFYLALIGVGILIGAMAFATMGVGASSEGIFAGIGVITIVALIAAIGYAILMLVFFCQPSQSGPNKYGPNPIDGGVAQLFE